MKVLAFIGQHSKDGPFARLFWSVVRFFQMGATYSRVTHAEALLYGTWDRAAIASASMRDGGVRTKRDVRLNPTHWLVLDVPAWEVDKAIDWFNQHDGASYDWRGALATVLWFLPHSEKSWFCNEAIAAPFGVVDAQRQMPSSFIALCMSLPGSRDVTAEFFSTPEPMEGKSA